MTRLATQRTGAKLKWAGITDEAQLCQPSPCSRICSVVPQGKLDVEEFKRLLSPKTKMVAFVHISNTLGCINPVSQQQCQCQDFFAESCWIHVFPLFREKVHPGWKIWKIWMSDECQMNVMWSRIWLSIVTTGVPATLDVWSGLRWGQRDGGGRACRGSQGLKVWAAWDRATIRTMGHRLDVENGVLTTHWFIHWLVAWMVQLLIPVHWLIPYLCFLLPDGSGCIPMDFGRGAFGRLSICTTPENWSLASHSSHSDCSLCNVKFASSCSWACLAPRMWLSLALTSWWLPVPSAKGTIYWVFGHVPPKTREVFIQIL